MFTRIWLTPPLAIGRVGSALRPMQNFSWAQNVVDPDGEITTRLQPEETLTLEVDGQVKVQEANEFNQISFKDDENRFYPVCPFFELYGEWLDGDSLRQGPITESILKEFGPQIDGRPALLSDLEWTVVLGNLKAYHYTLADSDRLVASVTLQGDNTLRVPLNGSTPTHRRGEPVQGALMVKAENPIPMGEAQLAKPTEEFPEIRLRIYSPPGKVFCTSDIQSRPPLDSSWDGFRLNGGEIVNPESSWANLRLNEIELAPHRGPDPRHNPGGLAARDGDGVSIGVVDDVSDGIVTCKIGDLLATARIAIGPPDFAPNARPIVSLQDGLADRADRISIRERQPSLDELEELVHDIFQRALETSSLMNKDVQTDRAHNENSEELPPPLPGGTQDRAVGTLWPRSRPLSVSNPTSEAVDQLPITEKGQRKQKD